MKTPQYPVPKLAAALGLKNEIWLKREDEHHYGSHKGRSIPPMISEYAKQGIANFVISSSGNAALAAALTIAAHNRNQPDEPLALTIFVGEKINPAKLRALIGQAKTIKIIQTKNPKQKAFQFAKSGGATWLRQSTDDRALAGYQELAQELSQIKNLAAVFIPTSSGTTAEGLKKGFQKLGLNPQIHIVQTTAVHPFILSTYPLNVNRSGEPSAASLATAIVDKVAHRKAAVLTALKSSGGAGWIASNTKIIQAQELIKKTAQTAVTPNGALALAGLMTASAAGWQTLDSVVLLITGR